MKRLETVQWAAEVLNVSPQRIYEMVRIGILPPGVAIRLGRQVRIDAERLMSWAASGGQALPGGWRKEEA